MNELEQAQNQRIQALEKVVLLLVSHVQKAHAISRHDAEHLAQILLDARPPSTLNQQKQEALGSEKIAAEIAKPFHDDV